MKKDNQKYINNNVYNFQEFDLNYNEDNIINNKIDYIYIEIINSLIKKRKFEDYDYICNIIELLDIENINITKTMYEELSKVLNSNESYVKDYMISKVEDLKIDKKNKFLLYSFKIHSKKFYLYL